MVHSRFAFRTTSIVGNLHFPRVPPLVVNQTRVIVAFVKILKDRREDLGRLIGKSDALGGILDVAAVIVFEKVGKVRGSSEDIFVSGEDALLVADDEGDDGADAAGSGGLLVPVALLHMCTRRLGGKMLTFLQSLMSPQWLHSKKLSDGDASVRGGVSKYLRPGL